METPQLIGGFKQRFDHFVDLYKELKSENVKLETMNNKLQIELEEKNLSIKKLEENSKVGEIAKSFIASNENKHDAKQNISKIVREIDHCIALLNR